MVCFQIIIMELFVSMKITIEREERSTKEIFHPNYKREKTAGKVSLFKGGGENSFNLAAEAATKRKEKKTR